MYLQREREIWHLLYPEFEEMVNVEMWSGASALVMLHFSTVLTEERVPFKWFCVPSWRKRKFVKTCVGLILENRKYRGDGKVKIAVSDSHDVVDYDASVYHKWIKESVTSPHSDVYELIVVRLLL